MKNAKSALPASGSHESVLRGHLQKIAVLRVMLLWGSQMDRFTQEECVRRLAGAGVEIDQDSIHLLYRLAIESADQLTAK